MDFDPQGIRLPRRIDTMSNGEYIPQPLTPSVLESGLETIS